MTKKKNSNLESMFGNYESNTQRKTGFSQREEKIEQLNTQMRLQYVEI